ncbi:hypothetical protein A1O3_04754 [Capronia epimyces CBS 606.96]|uniref:NmrA-like domain-containing protein n=1 Tax=Capronia epimyces CBS 606.96 TaxID=1182542 RepID=W9XU48_9EURO|nr:uncharacterized protein A1O3_04754 [Capronia epimyces CBS 606.96]EXJ84087.1 hypothetical protein A1O3_04754 [Capronia epimyces CBS 606.96]
MTRVAIAGSGDVARYFTEELVRAGHEVVILMRSHKPQSTGPGTSQFVTDYSLESVSKAIVDCDVLISTILDYSMDLVDVHLTLIEACKKSPKCKRFIPSEYGADLERHPDQPAFYYANHEPVRKALRDQTEIEWTLVCVGWLMDYIVPSRNRYLKDIGGAFPIDLGSGTAEIPGPGDLPFNLTAARDVAKAIAALVSAPAQSWETLTFVSGDQTTWKDLVSVMQTRIPGLQVTHKSLDQLKEAARSAGDDWARLVAEYQIFSAGDAGSLNPEKVRRHREKYFGHIHFRTVPEVLQAAEENPQAIV